MHTVTAPRPTQCSTPLRQIQLICDGNAHQPTPLTLHPHCVSEALLPEIRTIATLIAASRHHFHKNSPSHFTDEADWLAARMLVLRVRIFHLSPEQRPLLQIANKRAQTFAHQHGLAFRPALFRAHHSKHRHIVLASCQLSGTNHANLFENSHALRKIVFKLP